VEAICSSETSVDFQRTTQCYIPEDSTLHNHRCENLKSYIRNILYYSIFIGHCPVSVSFNPLHLIDFIRIFKYGLFNDVMSISGYTASSDMMMSKQ
jgi:hypothetical protein